jgi:hypothetical protein
MSQGVSKNGLASFRRVALQGKPPLKEPVEFWIITNDTDGWLISGQISVCSGQQL